MGEIDKKMQRKNFDQLITVKKECETVDLNDREIIVHGVSIRTTINLLHINILLDFQRCKQKKL